MVPLDRWGSIRSLQFKKKKVEIFLELSLKPVFRNFRNATNH
jgi:hypothetical protein